MSAGSEGTALGICGGVWAQQVAARRILTITACPKAGNLAL
jgi:hypothetical protein